MTPIAGECLPLSKDAKGRCIGRPKAVVDKHLEAIRETAQGTANLMPVLKAALADYVTIGECCEVLRGVFGEYRPVEAVR